MKDYIITFVSENSSVGFYSGRSLFKLGSELNLGAKLILCSVINKDEV